MQHRQPLGTVAKVPLIRSIALAVGIMLGTAGADAQEWTRFRGPNGTGISDATTIPVEWTESDYNWRVELPGIGHSSPVLWGDRIFLISAFNETAERRVLCINAADGNILWQRLYPSSVHKKHEFNSFASGTATVDEERVYLVWSAPEEYTLIALDHKGNDVWNRDLGPFASQHSCGTSPIVYKDLLLLGNDQGDDKGNGSSFLIAVDRRTGETQWQIPRRTVHVAYSTPCIFQPPGRPDELIFNSGAHGITSLEPLTGVVNWEFKALDKRSVSSPIIAAGLLFATCGSGGGGNYVAAVKPGAGPGGAEPELAYRIDDAAPYVPTLLAYNDLLFLWSDKGIVSCRKPATGEAVWQERVGGNFFGSPVCVNGKLYCISVEGDVVVLDASAQYSFLGRTPLGEECRSTPAVAGGRMYLRTVSHLYSLGGK